MDNTINLDPQTGRPTSQLVDPQVYQLTWTPKKHLYQSDVNIQICSLLGGKNNIETVREIDKREEIQIGEWVWKILDILLVGGGNKKRLEEPSFINEG